MTDNSAYLAIINTVKEQWSEFPFTNLSVVDIEASTLLSGHLFLPDSNFSVICSAIASPGMSDRSLNLIFIATLPSQQSLSNGLYAFLLQATAVMPPLEFIVDLQSDQLLIRQSQIMSRNYHLQSESFIAAVEWLAPRIIKAAQQIEQQALLPGDARQMADFLSEEYLEAMEA